MRLDMRFSKCVILALILTLLPATAFSAQKIVAGGTCKVVKQKVTYQKKVYTCTKSGKKLVWSKGVSAAQPKPTVSASASASASPTTSPTKSPTNPETIKLTVHYKRSLGDYENWNLWLWRNSTAGSDTDVNSAGVVFTGDDAFGKFVTLDITGMDKFDNIGFIVRKGDWLSKDIEYDRFITKFKADGTAEIWLVQGNPVIYDEAPTQ